MDAIRFMAAPPVSSDSPPAAENASCPRGRRVSPPTPTRSRRSAGHPACAPWRPLFKICKGNPDRVSLARAVVRLQATAFAAQKRAPKRSGPQGRTFRGHPVVMAGRTEPAYTARKGMCARETLVGFPLHVRLSARRRPLLQRKSAHQKGAARRGGHFWCGHGDSNPNA